MSSSNYMLQLHSKLIDDSSTLQLYEYLFNTYILTSGLSLIFLVFNLNRQKENGKWKMENMNKCGNQSCQCHTHKCSMLQVSKLIACART